MSIPRRTDHRAPSRDGAVRTSPKRGVLGPASGWRATGAAQAGARAGARAAGAPFVAGSEGPSSARDAASRALALRRTGGMTDAL